MFINRYITHSVTQFSIIKGIMYFPSSSTFGNVDARFYSRKVNPSTRIHFTHFSQKPPSIPIKSPNRLIFLNTWLYNVLSSPSHNTSRSRTIECALRYLAFQNKLFLDLTLIKRPATITSYLLQIAILSASKYDLQEKICWIRIDS
jgi:hypothetical protein